VKVVRCEHHLLHVVGALCAASRLAGRLHRREQERDEHPDDRNHHQQLDQREAAPQIGAHPSEDSMHRFTLEAAAANALSTHPRPNAANIPAR